MDGRGGNVYFEQEERIKDGEMGKDIFDAS